MPFKIQANLAFYYKDIHFTNSFTQQQRQKKYIYHIIIKTPLPYYNYIITITQLYPNYTITIH